jgi:hypothetical protein
MRKLMADWYESERLGGAKISAAIPGLKRHAWCTERTLGFDLIPALASYAPVQCNMILPGNLCYARTAWLVSVGCRKFDGSFGSSTRKM